MSNQTNHTEALLLMKLRQYWAPILQRVGIQGNNKTYEVLSLNKTFFPKKTSEKWIQLDASCMMLRVLS